MTSAVVSEADFIRLFEELGPTKMAKQLGITKRAVLLRRANLEDKAKRQITSPTLSGAGESTRHGIQHAHRIPLEIKNGIAIVGGDSHYWPKLISTAHRAYVKFAGDFGSELKAVFLNGDVFDGAKVSRHPPIGWEKRPDVIDELGACAQRLSEIEKAAHPKARRVWNLGNHDARFETRLAMVAPEFARVHGVHLKDHFPRWDTAWSTWVNDSVVIKHRYKGGIHATHNNTMWAGKSIVTNHLHSLKVTPLTDYNGTRFGVDCGTMAHPQGPQFIDYLEDNPPNWRQGFVVLTFHKGRLLWPQVCHVIGENEVEFGQKVYRV